MSGAVITFKPRMLINKRNVGCKCLRVEGDSDTELLECRDCGKYWTAWNWIFYTTMPWRIMASELKNMREEASLLRGEIEKLKREKSRVKRTLKSEGL